MRSTRATPGQIFFGSSAPSPRPPTVPRCLMDNPSHVRTTLRLNDFCLYSTLNRFYFYSVQGGRPVKLQWPRFPRCWIGNPCLLFYVITFSHRLMTWENLPGGPSLPSLQYTYKLRSLGHRLVKLQWLVGWWGVGYTVNEKIRAELVELLRSGQ